MARMLTSKLTLNHLNTINRHLHRWKNFTISWLTNPSSRIWGIITSNYSTSRSQMTLTTCEIKCFLNTNWELPISFLQPWRHQIELAAKMRNRCLDLSKSLFNASSPKIKNSTITNLHQENLRTGCCYPSMKGMKDIVVREVATTITTKDLVEASLSIQWG